MAIFYFFSGFWKARGPRPPSARVEDALHATRAAVEEGIVPGGGVALLRCLPAIKKLNIGGDEQIGVDIVRHALESPLRALTSNAGVEGAVVLF